VCGGVASRGTSVVLLVLWCVIALQFFPTNAQRDANIINFWSEDMLKFSTTVVTCKPVHLVTRSMARRCPWKQVGGVAC